jgi:hypothetical protein
MHDTPELIHKKLIDGYRNMPPWEKMKRISELNQAAQQLALSRIRHQYGEISEQEQRLRLAALWLDRETMIQVFGWDPQEMGY